VSIPPNPALTAALVAQALGAGFRGIDTANQRKHYFEAAVGEAIGASSIPRDQLFLQTKFTFLDGQDQRLPYDPRAPLGEQVAQSFASSLEHLGVTYLDSLVLHGPSQHHGLGAEDHEAWRAMEKLVEQGGVRVLGVSNVTAQQITELVAFAKVKPVYVQNRCYARTAWDQLARNVCKQHGITYQGFSLLTANRQVLAHRGVADIAKRYAKTPSQIVFRFAQQIGMLPLTGTTKVDHMRQDLAIEDFALTADELALVEAAG